MGICSSCLGHDRDRDLSDEDEQSRLLFDDTHANQYGSFSDNNAGAIQTDPQEVQRETEALQRVVTQTSNHLVDIFALVSQSPPPPASTTVFPAHDARFLRYQDVLAKLSGSDQSSRANKYLFENTTNASDGWVSDEEDIEETKTFTPIKSEGRPLLGGFADAESAME